MKVVDAAEAEAEAPMVASEGWRTDVGGGPGHTILCL